MEHNTDGTPLDPVDAILERIHYREIKPHSCQDCRSSTKARWMCYPTYCRRHHIRVAANSICDDWAPRKGRPT